MFIVFMTTHKQETGSYNVSTEGTLSHFDLSYSTKRQKKNHTVNK